MSRVICAIEERFVKPKASFLPKARGFGPFRRGDATDMSEKKEKELTPEELEEQNGEELPDREVMSLITPPSGADGIATIAPNEPPESS